MRSSGTDFNEAVQAAFGTRVITVSPTEERFNEFNGIYVPSNRKTVYVNTQANVGFVNIAGHELLHDLKRNRSDLYSYLLDNARQHFKNFEGYRDKLDSLLQEGEAKHANAQIEEELIADFMGDAIADPDFLKQLAEDNPTKFKRLLTAVTMWLAKIKNKLKGLGSEQYYNDVEAMRKYLRAVLNAYAKDGNIKEAMAGVEVPLFSREAESTTDAKQSPDWLKRELALQLHSLSGSGQGLDRSIYSKEDIVNQINTHSPDLLFSRKDTNAAGD